MTAKDKNGKYAEEAIWLYVAEIPELPVFSPIVCKQREAEVCGTADELHRAEKYYAWRLLERAAGELFGFDTDVIEFNKEPCRRWVCDAFYFSISHSEGAVAVIISRDTPVGVDIQAKKPISQRLAKRIMTDTEQAEYSLLSKCEKQEYALRAWCAKEALYKLGYTDAFSASTSKFDRAATLSYYEHASGGKDFLICAAFGRNFQAPNIRLVSF